MEVVSNWQTFLWVPFMFIFQCPQGSTQSLVLSDFAQVPWQFASFYVIITMTIENFKNLLKANVLIDF